MRTVQRIRIDLQKAERELQGYKAIKKKSIGERLMVKLLKRNIRSLQRELRKAHKAERK